MKYAGIDPGNHGGIALMDYSGHQHRIIEAHSMPTMKEQTTVKSRVRTEPDFEEMLALFESVKAFKPEFVTLEMVWGMSHDSAMTAFALGGWYKMLRTLLHLHGFKYMLSAPAQWKRFQSYQKYGLWGAGADAKLIACEMAKDIFPADFETQIRPLKKGSLTKRNKPHDGRADAALIGLFGACELMGMDLPDSLSQSGAFVTDKGKCILF